MCAHVYYAMGINFKAHMTEFHVGLFWLNSTLSDPPSPFSGQIIARYIIQQTFGP